MAKTAPIPFDSDFLPSIKQQADYKGWESGRYRFADESSLVSYFNCSLTERDNKKWLVVRRNEKIDSPDFPFGFNTILAFEERANPSDGIRLRYKNQLGSEHTEDPRAFTHNGETWVAFCNSMVYGSGSWSGSPRV